MPLVQRLFRPPLGALTGALALEGSVPVVGSCQKTRSSAATGVWPATAYGGGWFVSSWGVPLLWRDGWRMEMVGCIGFDREIRKQVLALQHAFSGRDQAVPKCWQRVHTVNATDSCGHVKLRLMWRKHGGILAGVEGACSPFCWWFSLAPGPRLFSSGL